MAWFLNTYRCDRCRKVWGDEWSCTCEDDCPHCGLRHMTPFHSEDLTEIIAPEGEEFVALRSSTLRSMILITRNSDTFQRAPRLKNFSLRTRRAS